VNEFRDRGGPPDLPAALADLPWAPGESFLGMPDDGLGFEECPVVVLPVPYEATVSFMGGTRFGPRQLLHASRFLETYDHELDVEPYTVGIYTLPELVLPGAGPEEALKELRRAMDALLEAGKFVIMVGGEHSISSPPILAHVDRMAAELSVLQLDAHTDLRSEYEGTPYSHACVMHRVHRRASVVPVGIRSLTTEERALARDRNIPIVFGHELGAEGWIDRVLESLTDDVYVSFDVDYFDPAIMPATGTPEPGGGAWYPTLELLERVFREKRVVGCDVVELAPLPGVVHPDVLAAKLVYKLIAFYALHQAHGS
jgi:agmatinase